MRPMVGQILAVVTLVVVIAACGGGTAQLADPDVDPLDAGEATRTPDLPPLPSPTPTLEPVEVVEEPDAFPRTVEHVFGTTEIPERPERIVALAGVADFDALLSLGVTPYAAASYYPVNFAGERGFAPWNAAFFGEIETFLNTPEINIEEIAAMEPDLIVGQPGTVDRAYDLFAAIAPTIIHDYPTGWREPILLFGEALDLEEEAAAAIARIEADIAEVAARVPEDPPSIVMVSPFRAELTVYHTELGAGPAAALEEIGIPIVGSDSPVSLERIGELADADWVIVFDFTLFPVESLLEDPLFQSLPAVQAGRVAMLTPEESFSWVLETSRSLPATLDGILRSIGL